MCERSWENQKDGRKSSRRELAFCNVGGKISVHGNFHGCAGLSAWCGMGMDFRATGQLGPLQKASCPDSPSPASLQEDSERNVPNPGGTRTQAK